MNAMSLGRKSLAAVAAALLIVAASPAWAKDSLVVDVNNASGSPIILSNGQAVGTIQLFYTVNATQFPLGAFATFDIDWSIVAGKKATNYGSGITFNLTQDQQGGNVDLVPSPSQFTLTGA